MMRAMRLSGYDNTKLGLGNKSRAITSANFINVNLFISDTNKFLWF